MLLHLPFVSAELSGRTVEEYAAEIIRCIQQGSIDCSTLSPRDDTNITASFKRLERFAARFRRCLMRLWFNRDKIKIQSLAG